MVLPKTNVSRRCRQNEEHFDLGLHCLPRSVSVGKLRISTVDSLLTSRYPITGNAVISYTCNYQKRIDTKYKKLFQPVLAQEFRMFLSFLYKNVDLAFSRTIQSVLLFTSCDIYSI